MISPCAFSRFGDWETALEKAGAPASDVSQSGWSELQRKIDSLAGDPHEATEEILHAAIEYLRGGGPFTGPSPTGARPLTDSERLQRIVEVNRALEQSEAHRLAMDERRMQLIEIDVVLGVLEKQLAPEAFRQTMELIREAVEGRRKKK